VPPLIPNARQVELRTALTKHTMHPSQTLEA
jgi:hypothetical protein